MWAVCFGACSPGIWLPQLREKLLPHVFRLSQAAFSDAAPEAAPVVHTHPSPWMSWGNWSQVALPCVKLPLLFCEGLEGNLPSYLGWPAAIKSPRIVYREPDKKLSLSKGLNLGVFLKESPLPSIGSSSGAPELSLFLKPMLDFYNLLCFLSVEYDVGHNKCPYDLCVPWHHIL